MVALVIVSLGMMAVNGQLNRYAVAASLVEQKTLASWIATNQITELSVGRQWPDLGKSERDVEYAGREWHSEITVTETDVPNLHRVDVSVFLADAPERLIHKVSGLIEPPAPPGFAPVEWSAPPSGRGDREGRDDHDDAGDGGDGPNAGSDEQPTEQPPEPSGPGDGQ